MKLHARPRPAMRGRYLVRNPYSALALRVFDTLLALGAALETRPSRAIPPPRRLLVANWAHLGDVVLALPALAVLRRRFPKARIDLLCGSWAEQVVAGTGLVDTVHTLDHWKLRRNALSRGQAMRDYFQTRAARVRALRDVGYDVGIDLYPFFPPASPLFHAANIPVRIGFTSGGFGPWLTHPVPWRDADRPILDYARDVLNPLLAPDPLPEGALRPIYPGHPRVPLPPPLIAGAYTVVHMGAGAAFKEWPEEHWREVIRNLVTQREVCVLTGAGQRELERAQRIQRDFPERVLIQVGAKWEEFVAVVAGARRVLCLDSVIGHVAACFDVSTVVIASGANNPAQWLPMNPRLRWLMAPVACAPCNRFGCDAMACVRGVPPEAVLAAVQQPDAKRLPHEVGTVAVT